MPSCRRVVKKAMTLHCILTLWNYSGCPELMLGWRACEPLCHFRVFLFCRTELLVLSFKLLISMFADFFYSLCFCHCFRGFTDKLFVSPRLVRTPTRLRFTTFMDFFTVLNLPDQHCHKLVTFLDQFLLILTRLIWCSYHGTLTDHISLSTKIHLF